MQSQKLNFKNVNWNVKETFFYLTYKLYGCIWLNKIVAFKKKNTLHSVEVFSSRNSTLLFVIVFWGETNRSSLSQTKFLPATLLKRDSNTCVSLWNLRNFQELIFLQNNSGGCFWTNPGDLWGSLSDELMLWSFSISLS